MRAISRADVRVGQPLPWSVYDRQGRLLLRRGQLVSCEAQIDRLAEHGLFVDDEEDVATLGTYPSPPNVMDHLLMAAWGMKPLVNQLLNPDGAPDLAIRVRQRAMRIMGACETDPAAAVASIHLDSRNPYRLAHPINGAVLCELIGRRMGMLEAERISLLCAALTCDLDLFDQPFLEKQARLSDSDRTRIRNHPVKAVALLKQAGVRDEAWLNTVLHHHERLDGTGYPDGQRGNAIAQGARILAIADSYASLVWSRPWRVAMPPVHAFAELLEGFGSQCHADTYAALVGCIGTRPPGSLVQLQSGETAVVREFANSTELPVYALCGSDGIPLLSPRQRNALEPGYTIVTARPWSDCRYMNTLAHRLWK